MSLSILGIGTATPQHAISQAACAEIVQRMAPFDAQQREHLARLYRLTGVGQRYSTVLEAPDGNGEGSAFYPPAGSWNDQGPSVSARMERYESDAPPLAKAAVRRALEEANVAPGAITHLVTVSCTGFMSPGVDIQLIETIGLPATTERVHVGFMGCHGALNGLRVAQGLAAARPDARILMVAVELCTLHFQYGWHEERNVANALFADGAAALVGVGRDVKQGGGWRATASGSCLIPGSRDDMTWRVRDHGFEMTLSRRVPELIRGHLRPWLEEWLAREELRLDDIRSWAVHPGGPSILKAVTSALDLTRNDLRTAWDTLRTFGNMSSPTVLFILDALRRQPAETPCIALGFGPGLVAEATLMR